MKNTLTEKKISNLIVEKRPNDFFDAEYIKADLKGRSVRGGAITVVAQGARFFLRMGSLSVLARLLTPQDFGLIAMVTAVTGLVMMIKDMGLSMSTVQKDEINQAQVSTLFWINVALSLTIVMFTAALAPVIAWFYSEPRLIWITLALAAAFIFSGLAIQHQALLRRQMRFGSLAIIEIASISIGCIIAIIAALYGAGYWALVLMELGVAIAGMIGVWFVCDWRPGRPTRSSDVRSMIAFGGNLTGFRFLNHFARSMDNVLIGRFWGAGQLGLYNKAYQLLLLPLRQITMPITAVAIPALSRLQNDPEQYRRYYYQAISMIAFITMPLVIAFVALSDEIIRIVLGEQWTDAAIIFKVLAFAAVLQPVISTTGWVYISLGKTKRMLHWGLISVPVIVLSFLVGLPWGPIGVATSYMIATVFILSVPCLLFAFRYTPIGFVGFLKAIRCPVTISLIIYAAVDLTRRYFGLYSSIQVVLYSCVTGLFVFALSLVFWPRARDEVLSIVRIVRLLKSQRSD